MFKPILVTENTTTVDLVRLVLDKFEIEVSAPVVNSSSGGLDLLCVLLLWFVAKFSDCGLCVKLRSNEYR